MSQQQHTAEQAAHALRLIMDGKIALHKILETIDQRLRHAPPGDPAEQVSIGLARALRHLGDAVADIPLEFWQAMLDNPDGHACEPAGSKVA
jgi:hypothetical protein